MVVSSRILMGTLGVVLLSACGGNHAATGQTTAPPASSQTMVVGALAGSATTLQMGGQPLDVSAAVVTVNGQPGSTSDLQPGVIIHGQALPGSTLHLTHVDVRPDLCGPLSAVDATGGKVTVLGTVVTVDALTVLVQEAPDHSFTPLSLADFKVGDVVRVFGTVQTDGSFLATRIERRLPRTVETMELRGVVSGFDATASTFMLGTITVNDSLARIHGTLANGAHVETGGTLSGTAFTALWVEVENDAENDLGSPVEARGTLTTLNSAAKTFTLLTFTVDYSAATVKGTLAEGAVIEVEGSFSATAPNTILATQVFVKFGHHGRQGCDRDAIGTIVALNVTDLTLTVGATTYWTDGQTVFSRADAAIAFTDLKVGDRVEVRALSTQTNAAGQPYASRVEEEGMYYPQAPLAG